MVPIASNREAVSQKKLVHFLSLSKTHAGQGFNNCLNTRAASDISLGLSGGIEAKVTVGHTLLLRSYVNAAPGSEVSRPWFVGSNSMNVLQLLRNTCLYYFMCTLLVRLDSVRVEYGAAQYVILF
jgi:hypothetical protein